MVGGAGSRFAGPPRARLSSAGNEGSPAGARAFAVCIFVFSGFLLSELGASSWDVSDCVASELLGWACGRWRIRQPEDRKTYRAPLPDASDRCSTARGQERGARRRQGASSFASLSWLHDPRQCVRLRPRASPSENLSRPELPTYRACPRRRPRDLCLRIASCVDRDLRAAEQPSAARRRRASRPALRAQRYERTSGGSGRARSRSVRRRARAENLRLHGLGRGHKRPPRAAAAPRRAALRDGRSAAPRWVWSDESGEAAPVATPRRRGGAAASKWIDRGRERRPSRLAAREDAAASRLTRTRRRRA